MKTIDFSSGLDLVRGAKTAAVCGHVNPDGDCIGSVLALALGLREMGVAAQPLLATRACPQTYDFLEGYDELVCACDYHEDPDLFILVDVPSLSRAGDGEHVFERAKKTLVIDHHQGDGSFADVAYVDTGAAAAGMLVWEFLGQAGIDRTPQIATCCYTALVTDTGRFQFQNADACALRAAADMTCAGASPSQIAHDVYQRKSWAALQLEALVITRIERLFDGKVALSWVTEDDFKKLEASKDDGESLIDVIRQLGGIDIAVMLREQGSIVRGSIRSKTDIDVAAIANKMNGGGHKAASGFTLHCKLSEAKEEVMRNIEEAFRMQDGQKAESGRAA